MKLLSIKAHGFKSFADKIEILVSDGITGIVGPNGSGKSNVVDAVRWVLGEQSLKEIRGGEAMSDVIFAGSASRKPLNRAWVALTFDNSDHYLASDLSEIEIKRVIYSSGENEYLINNCRVRRKDIMELFMDSGANADSFSIISQGKISEILKGKPTDRRVIIEEAASVLKYKHRKEETMRKLDNTQDNLEKVNLVIDELKETVEPLEIQAKQATKYLEFKEELEGIEIALLASDIGSLNKKYVDNKKKLELLNDELLRLNNTNTHDSTRIEELKRKTLSIDEEITSLSDLAINMNRKLSELETQKQVIMERKKYAVTDQKLESNILILKEESVNVRRMIAVAKSELEELEKSLSNSKQRFEQTTSDYRTCVVKKNTLLEELTSKNREELSLKNKIDIINDNIENDTKLPYAVKSVLNNPRLTGIHDVLCKLIDTNEEYVHAIEIALGAMANTVVVDDENAAKRAIEYLKDNKLGRVTFFPISVIKGKHVDEDTLKICKEVPGFIDVASNIVSFNPLYKDIIENQLGNVLVVNNIDMMNSLAKRIKYRYRIVTLDGEIVHTGGAISGGILKASNGLMNSRFELEKLHNSLNVTTNEAKLLEEHINNLDNEIKLIEEKMYRDKSEVTGFEEKVSRKNEEIKNLELRANNVDKEISGTQNLLDDKTDDELDKIMTDYLELTTKIDINAKKLVSLKDEKSELADVINEIEAKNRKANSEYNHKQMEIKDLELTLGKIEIKMDNFLNRLSEEYQMTYEKASQDYVLDLDYETARSKVSFLRHSIKDLGDVNLGSIAEFKRINTRYTFLCDQKRDLELAINDLMEIIADLDETMKERFQDTFNKVNEEFAVVFKKLFRGGRASLSLTDPQDLLNTGIEICAEPPGKSLKNINALSGGEMTLTAIALLFSILNIRTVPFCILDEVEAALDEVNVDMFGRYIKDYEKQSQFIIITHKKRTMEYVNTLYGITMQESGVSKLVSVKLENID